MRNLLAGNVLTVLVVVLALPAGVRAQEPPEGRVEGSGTATLEKPPEIMRLRIELLARGQGVKEALAKLKARREAVRPQLVAMGAAESSIEIDVPKISAGTGGRDPRMGRMETMLRERMADLRKAKPADTKKALPISLSATLTAEWPLKTTDTDELLIFAHELQEKVKAADLAGRKEFEERTPEERELEEEMKEETGDMDFYGDDEPAPGEPIFLYVSKISEPERAQATAEAFAKAKADAARLAKAAGVELGGLRRLSSHAMPDYSEYEMYGGMYASYMYRMMRDASTGEDDEANEAVAPAPGPVKYKLTVSASFALK